MFRYNLDRSEEHSQPTRSQLDYGEQDENGIDLSLIRENLRLTPLERIRKAEQVMDEVLRLQEYGRRHFENKIRADR